MCGSNFYESDVILVFISIAGITKISGTIKIPGIIRGGVFLEEIRY